jgi:hypothetical protein
MQQPQICSNMGTRFSHKRSRKTVSSADHVKLFHPRRQRWADHFAWSHGGTRVLGLTPVGRATVEALQLNREPLVNLRRVLVEAGEHPPSE